jgi:hypothetical protein
MKMALGNLVRVLLPNPLLIRCRPGKPIRQWRDEAGSFGPQASSLAAAGWVELLARHPTAQRLPPRKSFIHQPPLAAR